jgi:hypothetical protein
MNFDSYQLLAGFFLLMAGEMAKEVTKNTENKEVYWRIIEMARSALALLLGGMQ